MTRRIVNDLLDRRKLFCLFSLFIGGRAIVSANGIYGNGVGADAMSMGGAEVAWAADPLSAMTANPAGLGFLNAPEIDLGAAGALFIGNFNKPGVSSGSLDESIRALPEGAIAYPLKSVPVTFGLSFAPQSALLANWHYEDPAGGLGGISYGYQQDKSEILLLRTAIGVAGQVTSKLSIGATVGLLYNENELVAPYIFQDLQSSVANPPDGAKTLLNLHTTGFGVDATIGMIFKATEDLRFGIFYQSESIINSTGDASGNPYAQFGGTQLPFHYDAEVKNKFPQNGSAGVSWQFHPKWRATVQADWIDWAQAFDTLHISMSNGSNPGVNQALGSGFKDNFPLNWSSEFVYRAGLEYKLTDNFALRIGYCYGQSPVPDSTLTPMTAAIVEHTLTAGFGYHWRHFKVDVAYQYYIPATQNIGNSALRSGEYSNSSTTVSAHVLAITTGFTF